MRSTGASRLSHANTRTHARDASLRSALRLDHASVGAAMKPPPCNNSMPDHEVLYWRPASASARRPASLSSHAGGVKPLTRSPSSSSIASPAPTRCRASACLTW